MISVKGGTQTWSSAKQESSLKGDGTSSISSADQEKYFQGESLGDTLNKVADPNYIDESKKMRTTGNNQLGKDAFMTLLLTQMKNQDPTNPLKSHEMAAQLAQFTQLEKLNNINEGISGLRKDAEPDHNFQALAFIGKTITTDNSKVSRVDTESTHHIRFSIGADAQAAKMVVKDAAGNAVRTVEFKNLKTGKQDLEWNGQLDDGSKAPAGEYTVGITATGSNGRGLAVDMKIEGVISGVNFTPRGPQLMVGKQLVNMSDVKSISETQAPQMDTLGVPNMQMLQQLQQMMPPQAGAGAAPQAKPQAQTQQQPEKNSAMMPIPHESPKKAEVKQETKADSAKRAKLMKGDLNDAAMAQGLINELNKTGAKAGMG